MNNEHLLNCVHLKNVNLKKNTLEQLRNGNIAQWGNLWPDQNCCTLST